LKKIFLAALTVVCLLLTACGGEKPANEPKSKTKIGIITRLNVSEVEYNKLMTKLEKSYRPSKANLSVEFKFFDKMSDLLAALNAKQVDMIGTYESVADYLIQRNENLEILKSERILHDSFCFGVRSGDTILKKELDKAIKAMQNDGTLADLTKKYIHDLKDSKADPPAVEIPKFDGADTIKVAVTGDLPPLDLILADGTPAGFSTAVLAEIGNRLNKNIELINVDSAARASILSSKGADVVFWVSVPKDSTLVPADVDKPAEIDLSEPYFTDAIVHIAEK